MLKIRRPLGRLIFNMGIAIPGKTVFLIETAPRFISCWQSCTIDKGLVVMVRMALFFNFPFRDIDGLTKIYIYFNISTTLTMTSSNGNIFCVTGPLWGPQVISGFPSQRPVTRIFDVSLIFAWTNGWAKLRRHRAHNNVTVMSYHTALALF